LAVFVVDERWIAATATKENEEDDVSNYKWKQSFILRQPALFCSVYI